MELLKSPPTLLSPVYTEDRLRVISFAGEYKTFSTTVEDYVKPYYDGSWHAGRIITKGWLYPFIPADNPYSMTLYPRDGYTTNNFYNQIIGTAASIGPPEKAITPGPTNENTDVTLDHEDLTWVDGGLGAQNEATTFNVYYGTESGSLTLVSSAQDAGETSNSFTIWDITNGSPFDYQVTRYWRIDSTNDVGTTTGDEWYFTTMTFDPPQPDPPDPDPYDPPRPPDYTFDPNFIRTTKKIVLAAGHQIWYEIP